jgi:hypothetical protein
MRFAMDDADGGWWEIVVVKPPYPITDSLASVDGRVKFVQALSLSLFHVQTSL